MHLIVLHSVSRFDIAQGDTITSLSKKRLRGIWMSNRNDHAGISRRQLLRSAAALSAAAASGDAQTTGPAASRPNVVVVIADEVRWDAIGAYGRNPMDLTPNLNAMAAQGALYRHMFTLPLHRTIPGETRCLEECRGRNRSGAASDNDRD